MSTQKTTSSKTRLIPVILAGGTGSRLWPLSRQAHPKPFIKLQDGESLIQKSYLRALAIDGVEEIVTVTNREYFFYTKDEIEEVNPLQKTYHSFLLEPFGRNSAAAIAMATLYVQEKYGAEAMLLVLAADHLIDQPDAFVRAVDQAVTLAQQGKLVTFGIQPNAPKTGYGYIEADGVAVKRFVEKPDQTTAEQYLAAGNFLWNAGMFCFQAQTMLQEMASCCGDVLESASQCFKSILISEGINWQQIEIPATPFKLVRDISIDYAVLEKSSNVAVVAGDMGWSDIGTWLEFGALAQRDADGNHITGEAVFEQSKNCIVHAENKLVAGLGIENLIIADTEDALLIAHRDRAQDVRKIVDVLKEKKHNSHQYFPTVHRPWGAYTTLQEGNGFKLKRIEVKPGAALSLQSHEHRSEHWVVVSGTAQVTNGDQVFRLEHNQSTYIPAGNKHRLENPTEEVLVLIEVQCGHYLGEDDIVRYEDVYGRQSVATS